MTLSSGITRTYRSNAILILIFLLISGLYSVLLVRDIVPPIGLVLLVLFWVLFLVIRGEKFFFSPIVFPIITLLGLLPLSLFLSIDRSLTLPKIYALILGIGLFFVIVNLYRYHRLTFLVMAALTMLAFLIPLLGLLRADWSGSTLTIPSRILNHLGQLIPFVQSISTGGSIHVNTIGGTLSFFVPLLISLLWDEKSIKRTFFYQTKNPTKLNIISKLTIFSALVFVLAILIFTQSRGSYLGVIVGLLVLIIWKKPKVYWLIPMIIVITLAIFLVFANGNIHNFITLLDTSREGDTLQTRLDYWNRTVSLIQDFPFTGVGLGTYGKVYDEIYTFTPFTNVGQPSFYAHNMYLGVAASMGIPALIVYFALFSSCAFMVISIYRKVRSAAKTLIMGLSCGILANLIYGLWDNYLLGEKMAIILWIYLGIITAIYIHQNNFQHQYSQVDTELDDTVNLRSGKGKKRYRLKNLLIAFGSWFTISLGAIAIMNVNQYISLALAALGGIFLGYTLTKCFENAASLLIA